MESIEDAVEEMRRLKAKLPPRPSPEDVRYATQTIEMVDSNLATRLDQLFQQASPPQIPYHVFRAYQQMREALMRKKAQDEKRTGVTIKEVDDMHQRFDALIQKAQSAASHALTNSAVHEGSAYDYKLPVATTPDGSKHNSLPSVSEDTSYSAPLSSALSIGHLGAHSFKGSTSALKADSTANIISRRTTPQEAPTADSQPDHEDNQDGARRYSPKVLMAIDKAKHQRLAALNLVGMALEWIPELIGELTNLTSLDLSGNQLQALPESIGELSKLTFLNVHGNQLTALPDTIGCLTNLRILDIQKNKIEELPITIGLCTQLVELQADFNNLKVLPEATGNLTSLQVLSLHMNYVQRLPTTLSNLTNLVILDVHFNHLERIPDSVCYLPNLTKLDVSSNFALLKELPKAIGDMPSIRELFINNNAIETLPASFAKLTGLEKLELSGNHWVLPPQDVTERGKEAVLQYMAQFAEQQVKDEKEFTRKPSFGSRMSSVFRKKKNSSSPFVVRPVNPLNIRA